MSTDGRTGRRHRDLGARRRATAGSS